MTSASSGILSTYRGLPSPIYVLSLARGVSALGAFVYPFLTLTLTVRLRLSETEAGLILSVVGLVSLLGSLGGGWLSDRADKVRLLVFAQLGSALALICAGFLSDSLWLLLPLLGSTLSISCVRPASAALIAELTSKELRTRAFSLGHLGTNLGFSIGPLIAALLFEHAPAWIFWGDGLTTLLAAGVVWWRLGRRQGEPRPVEVLRPLPPQSELEREVEGSLWRVLRDRPQLVYYTMSSLLMSLAYAQVTFTLPITLTQLVGARGAELFGFVMSANGLFVLLLTPLITSWGEGTPHLAGLQRAALAYAVGFAVIALSPLLSSGQGGGVSLYLLLGLSVLIWTGGEVYTVNHGSAFVAQETPASHRGRVNGILPVILGLIRSVSPVLSGALIGALSLSQFWLAVGASPLLAFALLTWMRQRWGRAR